jgi:hypothetical protein
MFQYFLNYLREKKIKFILFPLELYSQATGEVLKTGDQETDGTNFTIDGAGDIHFLCVSRYISSIYQLSVLGHEVGHVYLGHRVRQDEGATFYRVNYQFEYEADLFSSSVLRHFGFYTEEQEKRLVEISQLDWMINTKILPPDFFKHYGSSLNKSDGFLGERIAEGVLQGISGNDVMRKLELGKE